MNIPPNQPGNPPPPPQGAPPRRPQLVHQNPQAPVNAPAPGPQAPAHPNFLQQTKALIALHRGKIELILAAILVGGTLLIKECSCSESTSTPPPPTRPTTPSTPKENIETSRIFRFKAVSENGTIRIVSKPHEVTKVTIRDPIDIGQGFIMADAEIEIVVTGHRHTYTATIKAPDHPKDFDANATLIH